MNETKRQEIMQRINDLHLQRGGEVRMAREIRESVGRATGAYDRCWHRVEELTGRILAAEAELEREQGSEVKGQMSDGSGE